MIRDLVGRGTWVAVLMLRVSGPLEAASHEEAPQLFQKAEREHYKFKDYRRAIRLYELLVDKFPKSKWAPRSQKAVGFIYDQRLGDHEKALAAYQRLTREYPQSEHADYAFFLMARVYSARLNAPDPALAHYARFWIRYQRRGITHDPALLEAERKVVTLARARYLSQKAQTPKKGSFEIKGLLATSSFGVSFPNAAARVRVTYESGEGWRRFSFGADRSRMRGALVVARSGLKAPVTVMEDGKTCAEWLDLEGCVVVPNVAASSHYEVRGFPQTSRVQVTGSFQSDPFHVWFSKDPKVKVMLSYSIGDRESTFSFEFPDVAAALRGTLRVACASSGSVIQVLEEAQEYKRFKVQGGYVTVEDVDPSREYVIRVTDPSVPTMIDKPEEPALDIED